MPRLEKTHCPKGHELSGDNVRVRTAKRQAFRICVTCKKASHKDWKQKNAEAYKSKQRDSVARLRKAGELSRGFTENVVKSVTKQQVSLAIEAIRETGKIVSSARYIETDRFYALRFFNPRLKALVKRLVSAKRLPLITRPAVRFTKMLSPDQLMAVVNAAVPRHLLRDQRDDIIGRMLLDLLEGRLQFENVGACVGRYVSADFRDNHNKYGAMSLDMKQRDGESDFSMIDMIPDTQRLWA